MVRLAFKTISQVRRNAAQSVIVLLILIQGPEPFKCLRPNRQIIASGHGNGALFSRRADHRDDGERHRPRRPIAQPLHGLAMRVKIDIALLTGRDALWQLHVNPRWPVRFAVALDRQDRAIRGGHAGDVPPCRQREIKLEQLFRLRQKREAAAKLLPSIRQREQQIRRHEQLGRRLGEQCT